jgi:hypothetical protein
VFWLNLTVVDEQIYRPFVRLGSILTLISGEVFHFLKYQTLRWHSLNLSFYGEIVLLLYNMQNYFTSVIQLCLVTVLLFYAKTRGQYDALNYRYQF